MYSIQPGSAYWPDNHAGTMFGTDPNYVQTDQTLIPRVEKKMPSNSLTWQQGRAGVSPASSAFTSAANDVSSVTPGF